MINEHTILRTFLAADTDLTTLVSSRIYAGRDTPPVGYAPADGPCVVFRRRGGMIDESSYMVTASFQFKCYGGGSNENQQILSAEEAYRTLWDALHYRASLAIAGVQEEGRGTPLTEQTADGAEWPYTLAFFRCQLRRST